MALGDVAQLAVELNLKGNFTQGVVKAEKGLTGLRQKVGLTSADLKKSVLTGVGMGGGLLAFDLLSKGIGAVIGVMGDAGRAASDMSETQSKLDQVFASSAGSVREWASDAARSMGLSQQAALEATGTFGNFLQAMGQAEPVAAEMSTTIVQLAADLGSFNNQDPSEVLEALRSGLAGETEPVRRFGVDISDAAVMTELLAQGVEKVGGVFTQSQKIQGRYALIMRQTTKAQGDFGRTADGSANKAKIFGAVVEDSKAKMGVFVNQVSNAALGLGIGLVGALEDVGEAFHNLGRLLDPAAAEIEDIDKGLRLQAEALGLNADAIVAYSHAQRDQRKAVVEVSAANERLAEVEADLAYYKEQGFRYNSLTMRDLRAERRDLLGLTGGKKDDTDATIAHADAVQADLDAFLALSPEERKAYELRKTGTDITGDAAAADAALAEAIKKAAEANAKFAEEARKAEDDLKSLADEIDLAKGGFKSFWEGLRADQQRIRYFIRHPGKLREETSHLESALERTQGRITDIEKGGIQKRERLAYASLLAREEQIRGRLDAFFALGLSAGNQAEKGMEAGFDPRLTAYIAIQAKIKTAGFAATHGGQPGQYVPPPGAATGGPMQAWHTYQVNEDGPEYLSMGGRGGWLSPAGSKGGRDLNVTVRSPAINISAYQTVRETTRVVATGRSGHNAL